MTTAEHRSSRAVGDTATALVGDSITLIEGAQRAGIASIGYANKPAKYERMTQAGAVITSMADLALWLRAKPIKIESFCRR